MTGFGIGRGLAIALGVGVLALLVTFLALRDLAGRLGEPRGASAEEVSTSPQLVSAFKAGPRLGDLRGLFLQAAEPEPPAVVSGSAGSGVRATVRTSTSSSGGGSVTLDQRIKVTGEGSYTLRQRTSTSGHREESRARKPPPKQRPSGGSSGGNGSDICGLPAMC